jgi:L-ascorbate metabolism protein UlaG (beta-lactamase superfamily)
MIELDPPWETTMLGSVRVTAAPAKHGVPENIYIFEADSFTVFFSADTLLIPELPELARRFPRVDLTLLPINGLVIRMPLSGRVVMNVREAAELRAILRPRYAVPTHYRSTAGLVRDRLLLKHHGVPEEFAR